MSSRERDALNAAITKAISEGLRPFPCWSCRDWFVQTYKRGRPRTICDASLCKSQRLAYLRRGRLPPPALKFPNKSHPRERLTGGWRNAHPAQLIFAVAA